MAIAKKIAIGIFALIILAGAFLPEITRFMARSAFKKENVEKSWAPNLAFTSARINMRFFRYKVAAIIFKKGIRTFPKSKEVPDAMFHMAQCYSKGGDPKTAQKVYEVFLEKYPKHRWRDTAKKRAEYIKANQ